MDRPHFRGSLFSPEQFIRQHFNAPMGEPFFVAGSFCSIMALEIYFLPEAAAEPKGKKKNNPTKQQKPKPLYVRSIRRVSYNQNSCRCPH